MKLPLKLTKEIQALGKGLPAKKLEKAQARLLEEYKQARIHAGEAVGVISAESIGEQGTQMTLDKKHLAGVAEMSVTTGLPRIIEILDARQTLKTPMMEIFLKKPYSAGKNIKELAMRIKETTFQELISEFVVNVGELALEATLDARRFKALGLTEQGIQKSLSKSAKGTTIKASAETFVFKLKSKDADLNDLYKLKDKLKNVYISGIKKIKQVLPIKRGDEYIIATGGTNLKEVLQLPEVDLSRTYSNDLHETWAIFGVEAVRQAILNEVFKVYESQGLNVNIRHIMVVADTMCLNGRLKGITRYGIISEKASVLARASFETPLTHIMNASLIGEVDKLNSVIENVMLNQPVPIGTGLPDLITKME